MTPRRWMLGVAIRVQGRAVFIVPTCPMNTDRDAVGYPRIWYDVRGTAGLVSRDTSRRVYVRVTGVR